MIEVEGLTRHFRVPHRDAGLGSSLKALLHRRYELVRAVDDVSFRIDDGEVVGFLGPNGAGKTTTLKCLAGLLYPTHGTVRVLGFTPNERRAEFLSRITFVMGQRNQLFWDLPTIESLRVNQAIYRIGDTQFKESLDELVDLLGLEPLLTKQVRMLSLGERMRCELAAGLLHRPDVLFLDEPTLGLDVRGQGAVRSFIAEYNQRHGATVLLTSHYMADVTSLAKRVVLIDHGVLRYDGDLADLVEQAAPFRLVTVTLSDPVESGVFAGYGEVIESDGTHAVMRVPRSATRDVASRLLAELPVVDVSIEEPSIEDTMRTVFDQRATDAVSVDAARE